MNFKFYIPTKVFFGSGCLEELATTKLPGKKALIVICGESVKKYGYLDRVCDLLSKNNTEFVVFDGVQPNPTKKNVEEGTAICKNENCDMVLGLGGGSPIDASKAIAIMATNDGDLWDYIESGTGKGMEIKNKPLPIVTVNTTAGTGTECDPWLVVTNEETSEKPGFGCDYTYPTISFVDCDLMLTLPKTYTAYQGFDALFHAAEGYIASVANPISEMYSLKSIELIGQNLTSAVKDGTNIVARENMALASAISGLVESTSCCTSEHAIAHSLGAFQHNMPHGAGLIMISVQYFKVFAKVCPERLVSMAKALGVVNATKPEDFIVALEKLIVDCGVDKLKMSDFGFAKTDLKPIAENAMFVMSGNYALDRKQLSLQDTISILENSFK
ncbi:MAG: iron-containing alcohol dehydrogenase [Clostridia bacterium]